VFPFKKLFLNGQLKNFLYRKTVYNLQDFHSILTAAKRYCSLLNRKNEEEKEREKLITLQLTL
jgi:hypothetical protein